MMLILEQIHPPKYPQFVQNNSQTPVYSVNTIIIKLRQSHNLQVHMASGIKSGDFSL